MADTQSAQPQVKIVDVLDEEWFRVAGSSHLSLSSIRHEL